MYANVKFTGMMRVRSCETLCGGSFCADLWRYLVFCDSAPRSGSGSVKRVHDVGQSKAKIMRRRIRSGLFRR